MVDRRPTFEHDGDAVHRAAGRRSTGKKLDRLTIGDKGSADAAKAVVEAGRFTVASDRDQAAHAQPAAAVHHLDAAAGSGAQARLLGQPHDAARAVALRGRADHLHADRRRADGRRGDLRRARARSPTAMTPATSPTSRASTAPRPRMRRKRMKRSGRPISTKDRAGSGDHAQLYSLIFNRALASQMASARLERTTVELTDGAGPRDAARDRAGRALPRLPRALRGRPRRKGRRRGSGADAAAQGRRRAGQEGRRGDAALHPAAAALFRSEPGQAAWRSSASAARRPMPRRCRR